MIFPFIYHQVLRQRGRRLSSIRVLRLRRHPQSVRGPRGMRADVHSSRRWGVPAGDGAIPNAGGQQTLPTPGHCCGWPPGRAMSGGLLLCAVRPWRRMALLQLRCPMSKPPHRLHHSRVRLECLLPAGRRQLPKWVPMPAICQCARLLHVLFWQSGAGPTVSQNSHTPIPNSSHSHLSSQLPNHLLHVRSCQCRFRCQASCHVFFTRKSECRCTVGRPCSLCSRGSEVSKRVVVQRRAMCG